MLRGFPFDCGKNGSGCFGGYYETAARVRHSPKI